ncbi:MAG: ATP-dependent DNA helicase RecG [Eubacterium sp.]|jgi:ATP-dependent DNA helicase RecG
MQAQEPIEAIRGIGKKTAEYYHALGIFSIRDLLLYFPRDYEQYPPVREPDACVPGTMTALHLQVMRPPVVNAKTPKKTAIMDVPASFGRIRMIWFRMPYIRSLLQRGRDYVFYGRLIQKNRDYYLEQPKIFTPEEYAALAQTIQPVYALTKGLKNQAVRKAVAAVLEDLPRDMEYLPEDIRQRHHLMPYDFAVRNMHFPEDETACIAARTRFAFDEFYLFLLQMHRSRSQTLQEPNSFSFADDGFTDRRIRQLPYTLTHAQLRTLREVQADMRGASVMQRLIQGDVGSGKTIVAFLAMLDAVHSGYQAAIMAPTDVLARQHYQKLTDFCQRVGADCEVVLLTGSLQVAARREALEKIRTGQGTLIVGTHALIQDAVAYRRLALVVTDEQHRFGVRQRAAFAAKGEHPHILVMSATPIPRTLAIILYGDLDISVIDELPARRLPVKNCVVTGSYRQKAYAFIEKELQAGHQAYIVCPLVEESEGMDGENVTDYSRRLREYYNGNYQVGVLHGKMKPDEKNRIMEQFLEQKIQILVATTVIEVGVDVPNATVMMIENAERFGLAQLHQLRGRVGRGDLQSYCIFMQGNQGKEKNPRLEILNHSNDGFEIAREDLKLRGPGEFFGIRQSGSFSFQVGDVFRDMKLLQDAAREAADTLREDPDLTRPEHIRLAQRLEELQQADGTDLNL